MKVLVVLCTLPVMMVFFRAFQCNYFDDPGDTIVTEGNLVLIKPSNFKPSWIIDPTLFCYSGPHMTYIIIALLVRALLVFATDAAAQPGAAPGILSPNSPVASKMPHSGRSPCSIAPAMPAGWLDVLVSVFSIAACAHEVGGHQGRLAGCACVLVRPRRRVATVSRCSGF